MCEQCKARMSRIRFKDKLQKILRVNAKIAVFELYVYNSKYHQKPYIKY